MPFTVLPWDFAVVIGSAILICFVATLYPSRQAAQARSGAGAAIRMSELYGLWAAAAAPCLIDVSALNKRYRVGSQTIHVLRDLDLDRRGAERWWRWSGASRRREEHAAAPAGRARPGRLLARSGSATGDITGLPDAELVAFRNRHVGFVFQFHHLLPEFSALENAEMPLRIARAARGRRRGPGPDGCSSAWVSANGSTIGPAMLSGGEQQRVAVARALVMQPSVLLADEPTGDLDEETADTLHALLREMHAEFGLTSVIATHNPRLAAACDRTLRLEGGRLRPA